MISNYWNNLNERERWMAGAGLLILFLYLFYLLAYSPLANMVNTKSNQLAEKQETLIWMEQVRHKPKDRKPIQLITNTKLLALIGNQLSNNSLKPFAYQLQQRGSGDIQLSFERVPYNLFLSWLWTLGNDYSITLKQFTVEHSNTPGVVKLLLIITANAKT